AIGDIHGDFDAFVGILGQARLIDPAQRWSGGNATLVQTGDFLDRGPKARAVMDLLMALQKDAPKQGGKIIVLMGNHEAMNVYGDLRYVSEADYASFADDRANSRNGKTETGRPAGLSSDVPHFRTMVDTANGFVHCRQSPRSMIPFSCMVASVR